ncbi:RodZ domain-containing protein [Gallibacterium trehalosifermentans]|uniref:RodZ domain-containing protein n=1 Tax=Gallibacterium trehalosifermentans TaxID=516935 RepID=A0ABV6GXQ3_9PAST
MNDSNLFHSSSPFLYNGQILNSSLIARHQISESLLFFSTTINFIMDQEQFSNSVNLGQQLRSAREKLGLTIEDVATKTNLKIAVLTQFENNEFTISHIPATFVRGYLRSYLKFLKLPAELIQTQAAFGEEVKNDLNKNHRTKNSVNRYVSHHHWLRPLSWIVVIVIIGMTVLWWWQDHQRSANERESFVEEHTTTENVSTSNNLPEQVQLSQIEADSTNNSIEQQNNVEAEQITSDNFTTTSITENKGSDNNISYPNTSTEALTTEMNKIDSATAANLTTKNSTVAPTADVILNNLKIEITGENCWLSVKDKNRKTLAEREYRQGEILDLTGEPPYSLIIGAPQNVKIIYQGQDVPLKIDGRVAKLTLPAQQN